MRVNRISIQEWQMTQQISTPTPTALRTDAPMRATRQVLGTLAILSATLLSSLPAHATDAQGRLQHTGQTPQHAAQTMQGRDRHYGGRDHHDDRWKGRGQPKAERPGRPPYPPRPVVVVPPCKRGGPGITPC
jgi:glucose dehydrogenase